jgi:hypothetical protein
MWNRIEWADWATVMPIIAFVLTAGVFAILVTRTILMKKDDVTRKANLPLEGDAPENGDDGPAS